MRMMIAIKNISANKALISALKHATNADNTVQSATALYTVADAQKYIERVWQNRPFDLSDAIRVTHFFEECRNAMSEGYMVLVKEVDQHDGLMDFLAEYIRTSDNIKILANGGCYEIPN